jgi:hypothetical protein
VCEAACASSVLATGSCECRWGQQRHAEDAKGYSTLRKWSQRFYDIPATPDHPVDDGLGYASDAVQATHDRSLYSAAEMPPDPPAGVRNFLANTVENEPPWVRWRLGLLGSNPGGVGLLGSVER